MKRTRVIALLLFGASVAFAVPYATATVAEEHLNSGQNCQGYSSSGRADLQYLSTGVRNTDTSVRVEVACPLDFDQADDGSPDPIDILDMWVWRKDKSTSNGFLCSGFLRNNAGTSYTTSNVTSSSGGTDSSPTIMYWLNPFNSGSSVSNVIMGNIRCYIPDDNSDLYGYAVVTQ